MSNQPDKLYLSKSLLNAFIEYRDGKLCGLVFDAAHLRRKIILPSSEAREAGQWFEFWATGQTPAYPGLTDKEYTVGVDLDFVPHDIEEKMYGQKITMPELPIQKNGNLYAKYQTAWEQAANFKNYIKALDIEIIAVGERVTMRDLSGTLDIRAHYKGVEIIIDLKFTGLLEDRWNELGWEKLSLPSKNKNTIQAYHYSAITGLPFYWMLFDSGKLMDAKFYHASISPESIRQHLENVDSLRMWLYAEMRNGFRAYPSLTSCRECPLRANCSHAVNYPLPEDIEL